jgi:amino acid adenylation domain-containing protein
MVNATIARPARTAGLLHQVTAGHEPDRAAVLFGGVQLTYRQLERRANRLAHALVQAGIGAGQVVGLLLERGLDLPVAQLAVMKSGAAWMPLDPQHPPARLAFQAADAAAPLLLTTTALAHLVGDRTPRWHLDEPSQQARWLALPETPPAVEVCPGDPAYLIYTSGSTGNPKGVLVPHRSAYASCCNAVELFGLTQDDRAVQSANPAFDGSVYDCFATLLAGGTMISAPWQTIADPAAFTALLRDQRVTHSYIPPAVLALLDPGELAGSALRTVFCGGEPLRAELAGRWSRPGLAVHNAYGPTEATVACTAYLCPVSISDQGSVPIGGALPGYRTYVLDQRLRPVPIGVPGQLYVAGIGVSYGYLGRPGLTATSFLPDPHGGQPGDRMYATGDRVRWRSAGVLEYLGRNDRQVKIRGQRVELGEIEHTLARHPRVRQCIVVLREPDRLIAYLVGDPDPEQVRGFLADQLPAYMVPGTLMVVPELPRTPNGKLAPSQLPEPDPPATPYQQPRTEVERWLAETWRRLLDVDRVGARDTFFGLGANSLHTTQLAARVRDRFGVPLEPPQLFANPTLEQLATQIDQARAMPAAEPPAAPPAAGPRAESPEDALDGEIAALERLLAQKRAAKAKQARNQAIAPVPRDANMACAFQQEGLWFVQRLDPESTAYHIGLGIRLSGDLDVAALERALHALVRRHEALRTRFVEQDGAPRQVIDPPPPPSLPVVDLPEDQVEQWATDEVCRRIDLAAGPVFRSALARVAPDEHVLALVVHHIVADGWSAAILAGELSMLYAGAAVGMQPELPELPVQPADHAAWQRGWLDSPEQERQLRFWRDRLADLPTIDFPTDRPRPANPTGAGSRQEVPVPEQVAMAARDYARTHRVSFLAVLQAGLLSVLHRYTGADDLPIGSIFSGRTRTEIEPLVGFFANTLVLRTDAGGNPSFAALVSRCHDTVLAASAHQDIPFSLVVDALQPDRVTGRNPLFQISLTLQPGRGGGGDGRLTLGGVTAEPVEVRAGHARFDLAIEVAESPDGQLALAVEYSTELFDRDRIDRLIDHYLAALGGGLAAPQTAIANLDLLSPDERTQVLHGWNPAPVQRTAGLLHQVTAGHDPDRVAIRFGGRQLTYGQVERGSNQLARALRGAGIGTGDLVALLLDRGLDLPVAQLAVMKAGAAWTLLDPQLPAARLAFQTGDAAAPLVLTTIDLTPLAPPGVPHWCLDDPAVQARLGAEPDTPPEVPIVPADPAYLLYTSGSAGTPKGVLVPHRSAYAYCQNAVEMFATTPQDRVALVSNPAFDVSIFDCFASLLAGATLIGVPREALADPAAFTALLRDERVTLAYIPPAILGLLDPDQLAGTVLRAAFCAGEAVAPEQVRRWSRPGFTLRNSYGPTEATVVCTDYLCPASLPPGPVPIGTALPNHRAYVLDRRLRPVPIGVPGQLHIAGTGVSHGYLKRPSLTATRFLPDPYGGRPGERMYATGDLVRWRSSGVLEYLGRGDRQVKLRGQRVELGEIEHALLQHPAVRQSAVVLHRGTTLAAYLVGEPDLDQVREFLSERLPTYMIPTAWVLLPELPVTPNGKLDLARLPEPARASGPAYVPPRTDTERWLATLWQDLLEVDRVGATDSFFDLGGNSLHATRLIARILEQRNLQVQLQHLFSGPSLEHLAARLDRATAHRDDPVTGPDTGVATGVVTLRAGGDLPPLFLVHPVGGSATRYVPLAPMLGDRRPVHAIEDPGLRGAPPAGIAERASRYVELVRQVQPDGPYHLGGWSLGGVIGQEMARQLTEAGANVAIVVALDSRLADPGESLDYFGIWRAFVGDMAAAAGGPPLDPDAFDGLDHDAAEQLALDMLDRAGLAPADLRDELRLRMRVVAMNLQALYEHRPRIYGGRLVLARAEASEVNPTPWQAVTPRLELRTLPGDHFTLLQPPQLGPVAALLRDLLDDPAGQAS